LPRAPWTAVYAHSEELSGDDGSATNLFDLQPATFWHTAWQNAKPPQPHCIVIDLGQEQILSGVRYLPRQDNPDGRIEQYRLYSTAKPFPGL
jgi:beta-galactosidase